MKKIIYYFALSSVLLIGMTSCNNDDDMDLDLIEQSKNDETNASFDKKGEKSIATIAIENGNFTQLVAALSYVDADPELNTNLVDMFLNGKDQYTVFAPTDDAFNDLYSSLPGVTGITDLPAELVLDVLLYHVAEGRRGSNSVVPKKNDKTIETLLGESFTVSSDLTITTFTGKTSNIETPDISASNGIIHIVGAVILPI